MIENENCFGKEKGCDCFASGDLTQSKGRHLIQLVHFDFLEGFFFELLRGCKKRIPPLNDWKRKLDDCFTHLNL